MTDEKAMQTDDESRVLSCIGSEPIDSVEILAQSGVTRRAMFAALVHLELRGEIQCCPGSVPGERGYIRRKT